MKAHLNLSVENTILEEFRKYNPQMNISEWCEEQMRMQVLEKLGQKPVEDLVECEVCHQPTLDVNFKRMYGHKVCKFCFLEADVGVLSELCKKPVEKLGFEGGK